MALPEDPAHRHRILAEGFTRRVVGVSDWEVRSPVPDCTARDVVGHLVGWLPGFLAGGGVALPAGPGVADDPVAAWLRHAAAVQALLDEPATATQEFTRTHVPTMPLATAIDRFYTTDVFLHTWDLARATGQDERLDPDFCDQVLIGMEPMDQMLRTSGQYGPRVEVPEDAPVQARLLGFIGRDPAWTPARTT